MAMIKECYLIPVDIVESTIKRLLKDGHKDAASIYLLYYMNPEIVFSTFSKAEVDASTEVLKKYNLIESLPEGTKLYNHIIEGTFNTVNFLEELQKKQKFNIDVAREEGKINAKILLDTFLQKFIEMYDYEYKACVTSKELGQFKNMIKQFGPERAQYIVEHIDTYWKSHSKSVLSVDALMKVGHAIPYQERSMGEW